MSLSPGRAISYLFDGRYGPRDRQIPRWIFLRCLGLIYFSAFYSWFFQVRGLIGPDGILPAAQYLNAVAHSLGPLRFWLAPTLLWFSASNGMLLAITAIGLLFALLAICDVWPRITFFVCFVCYLSLIAAAGDFSSYQSDGMLLEAGFLTLFFAPSGFLPGWQATPPPRFALWLLLWEWFRIYFESGVVKLASGDPQWRHLTAMDQYYQNGPLPTWVGWYVQHLPHWFQAATVVGTLVMELGLVWMLFLPRRWRIVCFCIVTPWQIGVILTANYAFLNYLVLALGFLLLDDRLLLRFVPARWKPAAPAVPLDEEEGAVLPPEQGPPSILNAPPPPDRAGLRGHLRAFAVAFTAVMLLWIAYATTIPMLAMFWRNLPLPSAPIAALQPFRIANQYGLFAVMTPHRYEIEFQGSDDGKTWTPYPFRYKPQDPYKAPGIYAPYQPRFDWNLWFASLGSWTQYSFVPATEVLLLRDDPEVLKLFAGNPFHNSPPHQVRAVLWQYWFTSMKEKRETGRWWRRKFLGTYAPTLAMEPNGRIAFIASPTLPDGAPN